ncbi:hypothetical protein WR25_12251 [Diploscapter pachys]|uniref:FAR-17a/AIG1-like protein n=1 Tax=Diploscapter pachys TaxID=2018661 RepID=A0A2A2LE89_9BILA|nr:hypothetical protein WR25_12251 [Diploscapter pachys]
MSMLSTAARLLLHIPCFLLYAFAVWFGLGFVTGEMLPIANQPLSRFLWLTEIDLYLQMVYHFWGIGTGPDLNSKNAGRVDPGPSTTLLVVILFWGLFLFDPKTLFPDKEKELELLKETLFNNTIHTLPLISAVLDLLVWNHGTPSRKTALTWVGTFVGLYLIELHLVNHFLKVWPYPILGMLNFPQRLGFFGAVFVVLFICYTFLSFIHNAVHGSATKQKTKTK